MHAIKDEVFEILTDAAAEGQALQALVGGWHLNITDAKLREPRFPLGIVEVAPVRDLQATSGSTWGLYRGGLSLMIFCRIDNSHARPWDDVHERADALMASLEQVLRPLAGTGRTTDDYPQGLWHRMEMRVGEGGIVDSGPQALVGERTWMASAHLDFVFRRSRSG